MIPFEPANMDFRPVERDKHWLILCDGRRVQICERPVMRGSSFSEIFDSPLNSSQFCHEMRWHFGLIPHSRNLLDNLIMLLTHAKFRGLYSGLTLIAPRQVITMLKYGLPAAVHSTILETVEKDLTYCPKEALSAYFLNVQ